MGHMNVTITTKFVSLKLLGSMSTRELYKRFVSLCQKWPKDETKAGRDYGELFRVQLMNHFPHGDLGQVKDSQKVEAALNSLERIANNTYYNENLLKRSSSSGLGASACRDAISNEGIRIIHEQDETSLMNRLRTSLSAKFSKSGNEQRVSEQPESDAIANKKRKVDLK